MLMSPKPRSTRRSAGFTLIELLVVIAIIAILTAIIFPVFATLRENARQKTSIANLHDIQTGLAQFRLDQGRYPEVLFGYVVPGTRMDTALAAAQAQYVAAQYFPGLYPEYINDPLTFTDGNNPVTDLSKTSPLLDVNTLATTPTTTNPITYALLSPAPQKQFYLADAYDISPQIQGNNQFVGGNSSPSQYVVRYQTSWTGIAPNDIGQADYTNQLRWTNPPAQTYVTCTTYHVPNANKVIVLWESGDAKAIDTSRFLAGTAGTYMGATGMDSASANGATFWRVSPTDPTNP